MAFKFNFLFIYIYIYIYKIFFVFCPFRAVPVAYGGSQARGQIRDCSCWPIPQPWQLYKENQASFVTDTTVHYNAGSIIH